MLCFQVAAISVLGNIAVDFTMRRSLFVQCGGVKQLVQLSKSMDSTVRLNALWALRNLMFLADNVCKEGIFMEFTASSLASVICGNLMVYWWQFKVFLLKSFLLC